jgi:Flp pilus assembly protein TadD
MFAPKHLGLTLLLSSILAACTTTPKNPTEANNNAVVAPTEANNELDLEKMAKERAAQGQAKVKDESKEKNAAAVDTSQEPTMTDGVSAELKKLATPVQNDYQKALVLMKAQQLEDAFKIFDDIQTQTPMFAGPVLNQALIRIQQQNYKEADLLLKKAAGINEKNPFIYNLQGFVARQQGQFANARTAYEKAIAISPKYAKAHFNLGVLADLYLQDLPLALQHYEAYQTFQSSPDATVAKWVVDLQKRTGVYKAPAKPAKVEEITVEETPAPVAAEPTTPSEPTISNADSAAPSPTPEATPTVKIETPAPNVEATPSPSPADTKSKEKVKKSAKLKKQNKENAETPVQDSTKPVPTEAPTTSINDSAPVSSVVESVPTSTTNVAPTTVQAETQTAKTEAPALPSTAKNSKEKVKKSAKSKKLDKNVTLDTATSASEPVKSTPSENTPTNSGSEPIPTTAAGVQP